MTGEGGRMKCKRLLVIPLLIIKSSSSPIRDTTAFPSAINNTSSKSSSRAGGEGIAVAAMKKSVNATSRWMTTIKTSSSTHSSGADGAITTRNVKSSSNIFRWAIHGVATELFHNIFIRTFRRLVFGATTTAIFDKKRSTSKLDDIENGNRVRYRQPPKREIAVVTGGTGGIGSYIVQELAYRGYDVVIAGRDIKRGEELVIKIQELMNVTPVLNNNRNDDESMGGKSSSVVGDQPTITFIEYHANIPQSALHMSTLVKGLGHPLSILINNAGIMGQSKRLTMNVNLLGPAYLTFALLPLLLLTEVGEENNRTIQPTIINVGSSAHLRATHVLDDTFLSSSIATDNIADGEQQQQSWIDTLSLELDTDLSTYAKSKLALMQLSTILRYWQPQSNNKIRIIDAHPGLVWTSLLRNHIGNTAVGALTTTGLANIIYKSPVEGAQAIVAALDDTSITEVESHNDTIQKQMYFVNGKLGGYASSESISMDASIQVWDHVIAPALIKDHFVLPKGWGNNTERRGGGVSEP